MGLFLRILYDIHFEHVIAMKSRVVSFPGGKRNRCTLRAYTTGLVKMSLEQPLGRMVSVNDYFHEQYGMRSLLFRGVKQGGTTIFHRP